MKKKLKILFVSIVVLIVVAVGGVFLFSEKLVRAGIQKGGTNALGVKTTLEDVDLAPLRGRIKLQDLTIGNPEGFKSDHLFSLGRGSVSANLRSLLSDEIVVNEIELASPEITLEQKGLHTNITSLLGDLKSKDKKPKKEKATDKKKDGKGKTLRITRIVISKPKVHFRLIGQDIPDLPLPTIELTEVANADGTPLMIGDVFVQVIMAIAKSTIEHGKDIIPGDILGALGTQLASLGEIGSKVIGAGAGALTKTGSAVIEAGAGLIDQTSATLKGGAQSVIDKAGGAADAAKEGLDKGTGAAKKALDGLKKALPGKN